MEVLQHTLDRIAEEAGWNDDFYEIEAFVNATIVCDISRTKAGLEMLLPYMGPRTVDSARREVTGHASSRGFAEAEVDWRFATTRFVPLDIDPRSLLPTDEPA